MKRFSTSLFRRHVLIALALCPLSALAAFSDVFVIGTDDQSFAEFENESTAGANYFYENGNYPTAGTNWTLGQEPLIVAVNNGQLDGFPRALTSSFLFNNIFFQMDAAEAANFTKLRLTIDFINVAPGTTHTINITLNGTTIRSGEVITADTTLVIEGAALQFGAVTGSNHLRIGRLGGTVSSAIYFDHLRLEAEPNGKLIGRFVSNKPQVHNTESATLSWVTDPGATLTLNPTPGGPVTGSSFTVTPTAPTTYTLSAVKGAQTDSATVTVDWTEWFWTFRLGLDDSLNNDFSAEHLADDDYYFAGNYTSVGGPNQLVDELLADDPSPASPTVGFERGVSAADPQTNIWFIMPAGRSEVTRRFLVKFDILTVVGTHELVFYLNNNPVKTFPNITTSGLLTFEFTGANGLVEGPNKFSYRRTGGTGTNPSIALDYLTMEDNAGAVVTITNLTTDSILGTRTLFWTATLGRRYRIQVSTDSGATWSTLALNFPLNGAEVTAQFFEDRVTPFATSPAPTYRILAE